MGQGDHQQERPNLLVWPSVLMPSSSESKKGQASSSSGSHTTTNNQASEGFVLGWNRKGDAQWPANTVVVAGVAWLPGNNTKASLEKEYKELQNRVGRVQMKNYCQCKHHRINHACQEGSGKELQEEMIIVAYYLSRQQSTTKTKMDTSAKAWLRKMHLPCIILHEDGYPYVQVEELTNKTTGQPTTSMADQLLLYDWEKFYRHDLCSPGSPFATILHRVSMAKPLMDNLIQTTAATGPASTIRAIEKARPSQRSTTNYLGTTDNHYSGIWAFWERYSMLAHHLTATSSSSRRKDDSTALAESATKWQWTPVVRLWKDFHIHYVRPQNKKDDNPRCFHCQKPMLCSKRLPQEDATNHLVRDVLDLLSGLVFGLLIVVLILLPLSKQQETTTSNIWRLFSSYYMEQTFLPNWLTWLESFPIGFKLNVPLTKCIGQEVRSLVILRQDVLTAASKQTMHILQFFPMQLSAGGVILVSILLGGSGCLALLMDILRLLTVHLWAVSEGFRYVVYRTELYFLATLWRLFRGKKHNLLRQRTDTMEYDSMQLLLGSILFVVTLFLLTTVLVYYAFFTILNFVVGTGASIGIWVLYMLIQDIPFGTIYLRMNHAGIFTSRVLIKMGGQTQYVLVTSLEPVPESISSILSSTPTLRRRKAALVSWLQTLARDVLFGRPTTTTLVEGLKGV